MKRNILNPDKLSPCPDMASSGLRSILHLIKLVNTIDGTSVVYDVADGVHVDNLADARALYAATDVTQSLQGKDLLSILLTFH